MLQEASVGLRNEIAARPSNIPPYLGLVQTLELLSILRPKARCSLLDEAATVWRSWPGTPTPYSRRRQAEIDAARSGCLTDP